MPPPKKIVTKAVVPEKLPLERLLVVFDYNAKGHIIFCQGATIEPDAREETAVEYHGILPPEDVKPGMVRVYEVEPVRIGATVSYSDGAWREAKAMWEMAAFHTGNFLGIWKDIPKGSESEAMEQAKLESMRQPELVEEVTE